MRARFYRLLAGGLLTAILALPFPAAAAVPEAPQVHAIQAPVWVRRDGRLKPLLPGQLLEAGDVVLTGPLARAQLDLPDGSLVKLGEQAEFQVVASTVKQEQGGFYSAALRVLKGAFRYTTQLIGRDRQRDIDITVGTATIGIRGTDVWGKASTAGDMVFLIEGEIALAMPGQASMTMAEPMHGMMAMPDGSMQAMSASAAEFAAYAAETEMRDAGAMMMMGGDWRLVVMSLRNTVRAEAVQARLQQAGYPAQLESAEVHGATWNRVVIPQLADAQSARMLGEELRGRFGITDYWLLH